jgi:hypothetical protein
VHKRTSTAKRGCPTETASKLGDHRCKKKRISSDQKFKSRTIRSDNVLGFQTSAFSLPERTEVAPTTAAEKMLDA